MTDLPTTRKAKYAMTYGNLIGDGAYREVYRTGKSKWVYKFDIPETAYEGENWGTNSAEMRNYLKLKTVLTGNVRVPEMHLINGVIAAEYIKGEFPAECDPVFGCKCEESEFIDGQCWLTIVKRAVKGKLIDLHNLNVMITKDKIIYIIDLGV